MESRESEWISEHGDERVRHVYCVDADVDSNVECGISFTDGYNIECRFNVVCDDVEVSGKIVNSIVNSEFINKESIENSEFLDNINDRNSSSGRSGDEKKNLHLVTNS